MTVEEKPKRQGSGEFISQGQDWMSTVFVKVLYPTVRGKPSRRREVTQVAEDTAPPALLS